MSQAYDLAVSINTTATSTPGIVHDPNESLVVGSTPTGEFLVWTYDPITHRGELQVASNVLDQVSTLSFSADGNLLINEQPLASANNIDDAVADAEAAAVAAAASAVQAQDAANDAVATQVEIEALVGSFSGGGSEIIAQVTAQADRAETAVASAEGVRDASAASADTALRAAGDAQAARDDAVQRASADPTVIFDDGTKSARGYASDAALSATQSRAAVTRTLSAAALPETVAPGMLFTRARCQNTAAGIVNIGPNVWTDQAGEAWATYRLEKAGGSIKFVGQGGSSTISAPGIITSGPTTKFRGKVPPDASNTVLLTCTPPTGFTGRCVIMAMYAINAGQAYTISPSFSGGIAVTERLAPFSPASNDASAMGVIYEGHIGNWPGGDLNFSAVIAPQLIDFVSKPILVSGGDLGMLPIWSYNKPTGLLSTGAVTLGNVPAQSLVLGMAYQFQVTAAFSNFGANMALIEKGNLLGAGPAAASADGSNSRNAAYGIGQGVAGGAGDFVITATFGSAVSRIATMGIAFQPAVGASTPVVDVTFAGGRDTLTEVGSEAEVWFNPDGRSVFVQIPK